MTTTYGSGSPVNFIKPGAINDIYRDTAEHVNWRATGLTSHDWERLESDVGSGGAGSPIVRGPFSFAFDTPGLTDGVAFYTPTVGEILLDGWIEVLTGFNGTTPKADISQYTGSEPETGLLVWAGNRPTNLSDTDTVDFGGGPLGRSDPSLASASGAIGSRFVPGRFATADPLLVVVSQNGQKGGADPGSTQGAARLYIVTATPVAF